MLHRSFLHPATKTITLLLLLLTASCSQLQSALQPASSGHSYYVSATGDDAASGTSPAAPLKTIDRINQLKLQPGDAILLHSGDTFPGQLAPQGSGTADHPIRIDRYGTGPLPVINLGVATGAALKLVNQEHWIIQNLEVTSGAPPQPGIGRQGIAATAQGAGGHTAHIVIRNCYIHDIWGQLGGTGTFTGYNSAAIFVGPQQGGGGGGGGGGRGARGGRGGRGGAATTAATATAPAPATATAPAAPAAHADDILIENNRIERIDRCGIIVWRGIDHIIVRGNIMENLGGDGIFMNGCNAGIMERNIVRRSCLRTGDPDIAITGNYNPHSAAMWIQNATDTLMQFNEAYDTGRQKGNGDGNAYDFDFNCVNCIAQYNYSRNNHGFLLIMERTRNNIARYNISENDQTHLVQTHGTFDEGNLVIHNTFYVDYGTSDIDIYMGGSEVPDDRKRQLGSLFQNNLFYATGQGRFRTVYTYGSALERKFMENVKVAPPGALLRGNWYFGTWTGGLPEDPQAKTGDPLLRAPGTGGTGLSTLTGYQLLPDSPSIGSAAVIPNRGTRDFFGNPLKGDSASFGAHDPPTKN